MWVLVAWYFRLFRQNLDELKSETLLEELNKIVDESNQEKKQSNKKSSALSSLFENLFSLQTNVISNSDGQTKEEISSIKKQSLTNSSFHR